MDDTPRNAELWMYFKNSGIPLEEISDKIGYSLGHLFNIMQGYKPLADGAKFKIIQAYPETAAFLIEEPRDEVQIIDDVIVDANTGEVVLDASPEGSR